MVLFKAYNWVNFAKKNVMDKKSFFETIDWQVLIDNSAGNCCKKKKCCKKYKKSKPCGSCPKF